jgi:WD40 repeat protein
LDRPLWQIFAISLLVSALSGMVFGKTSLIIIPLGFETLPMLPGLIFVLLLADLFLALILIKQREFRSSLTWKEYSVKALDWLALWAGRLFLLVIAIFYVLLPLVLVRKPVSIPDASHFVEGVLDWVQSSVNKVSVAFPALISLSLLLTIFCWVSLKMKRPPAPPPSGVLVVPTDASSSKLFHLVNDSALVLNRKAFGSNGRMPQIQNFQFTDAGRLEALAVTYNLRRIFVSDSQHGLVHVLNSETGEEEGKHLHVGPTARALAISSDGRKLYVAVVGPIPIGVIRVFSLPDLSESAPIQGIGCPISLFATSIAPLLFVATQCGAGHDPLYVIDTRNDQILKKISGFAVGHAVVATPNGSTIFVSTGDHLGIVRKYKSQTPAIYRHRINISAMAISPDGRLLLVGTDEGIRTMNVSDLRWLKTIRLEGNPTAISIAPDGAVFALLPQRLFTTDLRALE